jgi:hypothetical protein
MLAAASGLVAAASVAVTIAVAGGGTETIPDPYASPGPHAHPDRAALYQRSVEIKRGGEQPQRGPTPAERFHHFR